MFHLFINDICDLPEIKSVIEMCKSLSSDVLNISILYGSKDNKDNNNKVYIDSCSQDHLTSGRTEIDNFENENYNVTVAPGETHKSTGTCDLLIKNFENKEIKIENAKVCDKLKDTYLSVSKLTDAKKKVMFEDDVWYLIKCTIWN